MRELLHDAARRATAYLDSLPDRRVFPDDAAVAALQLLHGPLPEAGMPAAEVLARLDEIGSPATVASAGARYFGFVIGGALPATVAASWLAAAWDQNAGMRAGSPVAATLEDVASGWLLDLLGLPASAAVGFVTGATMANFACLGAARHRLLQRRGWDVEERGLFGAPELRVVVGQEVHVSVLKALSLLGLGRGRGRVERVPVDGQGRLRPDALPDLDDRTVVCLQAGNVDTGAVDPAAAVIERARRAGSWVHVDGAFGLWALAAPRLRSRLDGIDAADSWATDAHKWLNVPYDSGLAFCRDQDALRAAMSSTQAAYLVDSDAREPHTFTPEMSRRARGVEVWAALASLGRRGTAELVDRCCRLAERFAGRLRDQGIEVLNDIALNQVLVHFGDGERTRQVVEHLQRDGTLWAGSTFWQGRHAVRISVSGWCTGDDDVDRSVAALLRC